MIRVNGENVGGGGDLGSMPSQGSDAVSRNLQSQIANAQKELQELSQNQDMPSEEKMKKRQELNQKIADLNSQLKQHEAELRKEKQMETAESKQESAGTARNQDGDTAEISPAGMEAVLSADSSLKLAKVQGAVKKKMEGNARVLESEIKTDAGRGKSVENKQNTLSKLEQRISDVTSGQMQALGEADQALKKGAGTSAESAKETDKTEAENRDSAKEVDDRAEETRFSSGEYENPE